MPSYAPNFTARVRMRYRAANAVHSQTWRCPAAGTLNINIATLRAAIENIWSDLTPILYDDVQCLAVTYALENSNIFLPTDNIVLLGTIAVPTDLPEVKSYAVSLVGRTALGQPAKDFFYGVAKASVDIANGQNWRLNPGESAEVDAAIATANGFFTGLVMCGSDGTGITWYPYANQKHNDYWVKRLRQGS